MDDVRARAFDDSGEHDNEVRWLLHQARRGNRLDMADRMAVAGWVMADRKALGLTQARLSELSNVPVRTIKHMEAGGVPQTSTLLALVDGITKAHEHATPAPSPDLELSDSMRMFIDTVGPMFEELSPQAQGQALRQFVLWLNEIKENE
ncbi:helix-turn-helix domain-containing protein [Nocardia sp. NBC_01327]|uniref:helix-turn-helix domain-containing protein n=1 Tax=Nocardia sp. NBC_01327 TaxID=2903593 RepID=UPI002E122B0F|nr:helix-turn-helix transcriptional regulator [Nocardia sp. NBC_01327]